MSEVLESEVLPIEASAKTIQLHSTLYQLLHGSSSLLLNCQAGSSSNVLTDKDR